MQQFIKKKEFNAALKPNYKFAIWLRGFNTKAFRAWGWSPGGWCGGVKPPTKTGGLRGVEPPIIKQFLNFSTKLTISQKLKITKLIN